MQSIAGPGVRLEGYADVFRGWCRLGAARELSSMQPPPVAVAVSNILAVENRHTPTRSVGGVRRRVSEGTGRWCSGGWEGEGAGGRQ